MRTTLTIDDVLANALKQLAHESGKPFKQIVNEILLVGLNQRYQKPQKNYRLRPISLGLNHQNINLDKALQVADELESEALLAKMELRK